MQLKLQLEGQVTELRSQVQGLETALATARREHAELTEQYKVGVGPGGDRGRASYPGSKLQTQRRWERRDVSGLLRWFWHQKQL